MYARLAAPTEKGELHLIVGLQNPWPLSCKEARHNTGGSLVERLAAKLGLNWTFYWGSMCYVAKQRRTGWQVALVLPMCSYNISGTSVARVAQQLATESGCSIHLTVVHDELGRSIASHFFRSHCLFRCSVAPRKEGWSS